MSDKILKDPKKTDTQFNPGFALFLVLLVVLIPLAYTILTNLKSPSPPIEIIPVVNSATTPPTNSASAIENSLKAVVDSPGFHTYLNLGLVYYNSANYDESIKAWKKALKYNPKSDLAYNNIAAAYGALRKWDEEIEACNQALAINPDLALAKRNLKWAQEMKNKK